MSIIIVKDLFTPAEAAKYLGTSVSTFYRTGRLEIPAYRPSPKTVLFYKDALDAWKKEHTVTAENEGGLFDGRTRIGRAMAARRRQEGRNHDLRR